MANYIYSKVKEALGGSRMGSSSKTVIKDWTPNGVKALVICRSFIIVANHIKPPRLYQLDLSEVTKDLQGSGSTGAIHNLLKQRQLSCLEEIYVDSVFNNYKHIFNMDTYIASLLNEKSRLRVYGYCDGTNGNVAGEMLNNYRNAQIRGDFSYCYAFDRSRSVMVQYKEVGNSDWYKNYNLRPQFYSLDADRGQLHTWFKKCENRVISEMQEKSREKESNDRVKYIRDLFSQDANNCLHITNLMSLQRWLKNNSKDSVDKMVFSAITTGLSNLKVLGLHEDEVRSAVTGISIPQLNIIVKAYKLFGLFDSDSKRVISVEGLKDLVGAGQGFIRFFDVVEDICYKVISSAVKKKGADMMAVYTAFMPNSGMIGSKRICSLLKRDVEGHDNIQGYVSFLYGVCGWSVGSLKEYSLVQK